MAAAPLLLLGRDICHLRLRLRLHTTLPAAVCLFIRRPCYTTAAAEFTRPIKKLPSPPIYDDKASLSTAKPRPPKDPKWENDPDYRKWKDKEAQILRDIHPITLLIKDILHSDRYMDGERLTVEDEKTVVEKLLAFHPHSQDKIGSGLHSIMVDRHPQFRDSRCLFVVRTDGIWIDFSYQKCMRAYIRHKYPSHAERFIKEHYKRSSS